MKSLCIVQARMGSTRLPGKVLREVKGKPLIVHTLERLRRCRRIDHIILATSTLSQDAVLLEVARRAGVEGFAGSEQDVLDRYYRAALPHAPEAVVRVTGDCPLIDPEVSDAVITRHHAKKNDFTSNTFIRSYPRGLDTEVMSFPALERAAKEATKSSDREHVSDYFHEHRNLFSVVDVVATGERYHPDLRLCVDTPEDFELIKKIFNALYDEDPFFSVHKILALLRSQPSLREINSHVQQKKC